MLSVFAAVGRGQAAAQPKPLVNADIVKMVKAGLAENTIVLAIQNKPSSFDTSPEELIRLKEQGVSTRRWPTRRSGSMVSPRWT